MAGSKQTSDTKQTPSTAWHKLRTAYASKTSTQIRALDVYLLFCFATGMLQLAYCIATRGAYYQTFLAGFLACVGAFVLAANVRLQLAGKDKLDDSVSAKAVAEFVLGHIILHLLVANFFMV